MPDGGSVLLIVVDTLRADHLGVYGYSRPTSPNLDIWAAQGRVYERAFATGSWTLPSFGSIYTGRWSTVHRAGVAMSKGWRGDLLSTGLTAVPTIAEILREHGFATGAIMNNPYLDPSFGVSRGFEVYDYVPGDHQDIRRADVMVHRALELIDTWGERRFFLVLHLFDPHMVYDPPEPVRGSFSSAYQSQLSLPVTELGEFRRQELELSAEDVEFVRAAYDEEIVFVDQQLAVLRDGLASRRLLNDSLIMFMSDHGEELFEHDGFEHGHAMWQEVVHVPLVVWGPDVEAGRERAPVSLVDIAPTILDWLGVEASTVFDGLSLWPNLSGDQPVPDRTIFLDGLIHAPPHSTVIQWPFKMIVGDDQTPLSIVDLDRDPREQKNVIESHFEVTQNLMADLHDLNEAAPHASTLGRGEPASPSADILTRLRSLGYVR